MNDQTKAYGGFVVLPLSLLAMRETLDQILEFGFSWGVVHFLHAEETLDQLPEHFENRGPVSKNSAGYLKDHCMEIARKSLGFSNGTMDSILNERNDVEKHLSVMLTHNLARGCTARIKSSLLFNVRDSMRSCTDGPMSENQFRIYMGMVSVIGDKPFAKVGWKMLQARAAGLLSPADLSRAQSEKLPHGPILSRRQIDWAVSSLVRFGWVKGFGYGKGQVGERYWSHRLSLEDLRKEVRSLKLRSLKNHCSVAENLAFSDSIRSDARALLVPPALRAERESNNGL